MDLDRQAQSGSWYTEFFPRFYLPFYTAVQTPESAARDVDFIGSRLRLNAGARVLDLCCGHGRLSLELARRGMAVTGLDLSAAALDRARAAAAAEKLPVRWLHRDMRTVAFAAEFDVCINWLAAFGMLESDKEDQRVLDGVGRALRPGGQLLLDTVNQAWLLRHYQPRASLTTPSGVRLTEDRHFDLCTGRHYVRVTATEPDGTQQQAVYYIRTYTLVELARMLAAAGMHLIDTWGDLDGTPYGLDSRRMIIRAGKMG